MQAAIAAEHVGAARTDWARVAALYARLAQLDPSPVVELNRAVAVAMAEGPEAGLELIGRARAAAARATTTCCTPRGRTCCAGSAAPRRPRSPTGGRAS